MTKFKKFWVSFIQVLGVYLFTLMGIVMSQYAPLLLKQGTITTPFQWLRLGISAVIAFYIIATDEGQGDQEAKKLNLSKRLATAFTHGFTWNGILGIAGQAAGQ